MRTLNFLIVLLAAWIVAAGVISIGRSTLRFDEPHRDPVALSENRGLQPRPVGFG